MLSKKDFCKIIDDLQQNERFLTKLNELFSEFKRQDQIYSTGLEDTVINLLEIIFKDTENQWITYWIWEENYGKSYRDGDVTEMDGTIIPLATTEDLYDLLIKNMENENDD